MGVWIETFILRDEETTYYVTPHVGVWIETYVATELWIIIMSLPMWECGLKQI